MNSSAVLVLYTAVPSTPSQLTHHEQQYSCKAVYCSTYIFVEHQASTIGISVSETKASYRLLCLALKRRFCDHEGYENYVPSKTGALGTLKGPLPKLSCFRNVSPRKQCVSTGDVFPPLTRQRRSGRNRGLTKSPTYSPDRTKVYCSNRGTIYNKCAGVQA